MDSANSSKPPQQHLDLKQASFDDRRESNASSGSLFIQTNTTVNANGLATSPGNRHSSISGVSGGGGRRRASMFDPIDPAELQKTLYKEQLNVN
jgi:hypothetical protein